ncbi:hypothetical protein GIB67_017031 [Kingdonia uniflora]|uniref:Multiple inositol polyphosphate phosphatase 1 n=1 Tax=Kingdonia uniflora TaxID=39325 RepID=A0A7J7ND89_9MAGN|nr:hypothetical protein GIB67_017031 [Kingdonia uniflora]
MAVLVAMLILLVSLLSPSYSEESFDVRQHLSTVSSYGAGKVIAHNGFVPSTIPEECTPIHINLLARHGTRAPTKKRIKELEGLADRLEVLLSEAKQGEEKGNVSMEKIPAWIWGWKSSWKGKQTGGELISKGEDELYNLGLRVRERFPNLFDEEYHPDIYTIIATQVPRASASAVAFGMGLFKGKGNLGSGQHRAFAVISESRARDTLLRFHDTCGNYKDYKKKQEPAVNQIKEPVLDEVSSSLVRRWGLNFTRQDTASLWFLCKEEASLLDITNQACGLFTPDEISLLEWADDVEAFILKGYGKSINYRMGIPLLQDVVQSMEQAIKAKEEYQTPGTYEKARLRFAHAETVVPFSCLLGLFRESEGTEFERIQSEQPLELPPKPPQKRNWRVSTVAPFAGNNMLVLYSCPANNLNKYFVQVLHNEVPVPLPGCGNKDFCPFETFKEKIVNPHMGQNYDSICNIKLEQPVSSSPVTASKSSKLLSWFFSPKKTDEVQSPKHDL